MEWFAPQWFTLYYAALGFLLMFGGGYLLLAHQNAQSYLLKQAQNEQPPVLLRRILKYFFLFTIPCLILSFTPFSWIELLFSLWSLIIIYMAGLQLLRWPQVRKLIKTRPEPVAFYVRLTGAIMMAVSLVMFVLSYLSVIRIT